MNIKPFAVEEWMNAYETGARYNIAETCVDSLSLEALFELVGEDLEAFFRRIAKKPLTYGDIEGSDGLKAGIARLYCRIDAEDIVPTHGAAGANHHVFLSLIEPGDEVVSVMPTYQQLYSIPESLGAKVSVLQLEKEDGYLPDLEKLRALVTSKTKMICINNPNNPTGSRMDEETLLEIAEVAGEAGAYLLSDEVYRHLDHNAAWSPSAADLYEKGISTGSMSKVFSLAGLRMGWIATRDASARRAFLSHRDYNLISCGVFDDAVSAVALKGSEAILARNRKLIAKNLAILDAWIQDEPKLDYVKPTAGTTALVHYRGEMDSSTFCDRLFKETGTLVVPGDAFEEPKSFRIGYACSSDTLRKGLQALSDFLRRNE